MSPEFVSGHRDPQSLDLLLKNLKDPSEQVRFQALGSLTRLSSQEEWLPLLRPFLADSNHHMSRMAYQIICYLGVPAKTEIEAAARHPQKEIREIGFRGLLRLDADGLAIVVPLLDDLSLNMSHMTEEVLGCLRQLTKTPAPEETIQARRVTLLASLFNHREATYRRACVEAVISLPMEDAVPLAQRALKDPDFEVRTKAKRYLGSVGKLPIEGFEPVQP